MGKGKDTAKSINSHEKDHDHPPEDFLGPADVKQIQNPDTVSQIYHDVKSRILQKLIDQELTIRALSENMQINPGTIKKYLDDLIAYGLVVQSKLEKNEYGITLKYYRAVAKKFLMHFEFPNAHNAPESDAKK